MAADETTGSVHADPNFAVICSFFQSYGDTIGFPNISFTDLERWIEDTRGGELAERQSAPTAMILHWRV